MLSSESSDGVDVAVIGAGVVGLACGAALAARGLQTVIVDRAPMVATETSSRNSGVVHAGLYYPVGSMKARTCVEGRRLLYARCERDGIPHSKTGKLVVATTEAERESLFELHRRGLENGAGSLELLEAAAVQAYEPRLRVTAGLWSPESGIVDVHALCASYASEARAAGAEIALRTEVVELRPDGASWSIWTREVPRRNISSETAVQPPDREGAFFELRAHTVVNAAGLASDRIAALAGVDVERRAWRLALCKGDYFRLSGRLRHAVRRLVYPLPGVAGLGIHLTPDLAGFVRAGPDAQPVEGIQYDVDPAKRALFADAVRRYFPELRDDDLSPDYSGIRPQLPRRGAGRRDFVVAEEPAGLLNLIGIESPGLTASGALALEVVRRITAA